MVIWKHWTNTWRLFITWSLLTYTEHGQILGLLWLQIWSKFGRVYFAYLVRRKYLLHIAWNRCHSHPRMSKSVATGINLQDFCLSRLSFLVVILFLCVQHAFAIKQWYFYGTTVHAPKLLNEVKIHLQSPLLGLSTEYREAYGDNRSV